MNPNYAERVRAKLDRLLGAGFIRPIKSTPWLSPIVVITKKNGQIRVCVDYRKVNAQTMDDPFPVPFTIVGYELYNFLGRFSGYNQVRPASEDQDKTSFVRDWGVYVVVVMMFGLKIAPATF